MNKKYIILIVLTLILSLGIATIAGAQGPGGMDKTQATNFTLLNFGTSDATVTAAYNKDGATWTGFPADSLNFTIAANGGQQIFAQYNETHSGTAEAGQGSLVISSDQELGAVVQIQANYVGNPGGQAASNGAYSGVSQGAASFSVPLVMRRLSGASGVSSSQIVVQNTGDADVVVNVTFYSGVTGASENPASGQGKTIVAGNSWYYNLDTDASDLNGGEGFYGSASVDVVGTGEIAVVTNLFLGDHAMQTFGGFAAADAGPKWLVPLFTSRLSNGTNSPIAIQNLSGATISAGDITMACTSLGPDPQTFTVQNTADVLDKAPTFFNPVTAADIPAAWYGSCVIDAPGNVVSFIQMRRVDSANPTANTNNHSAAFAAINASGTNKTVQVPLVAKMLGNGFATALTIQNLSTSEATVSFNYQKGNTGLADIDNATHFTNKTIPAQGSLTHNLRNANVITEEQIPAGWYGTVTITSDQPIDGFVQLTNTNDDLAGDTFMAHNVFTQP